MPPERIGASRGQDPIEAQRRYYAKRRPVRIEPVDTPYVRRHFDEAVGRVNLGPDEAVCEWGAGMGRFSALLAARCRKLTSIELSPELASICRRTLDPWPQAAVEVGDVLEVASRLSPSFDVVTGFFVLHHFPTLEKYFRAARRLLAPAGRFVFVEPNPANPLFAVQITFTPGMRWSEDRGVYRMWPAALRRAAEQAGFGDFAVHRYGSLPRIPYNVLARLGVERWPEPLTPASLRPFQVFTGRLLPGIPAGGSVNAPRDPFAQGV